LLDLTGDMSAREWADTLLELQRLPPKNAHREMIQLRPEQLAQFLSEFCDARMAALEEKVKASTGHTSLPTQHFATMPLSHEQGRDLLSPDVPIRYEEAALAREALVQYAAEIEDLGGNGIVFRTVAERINQSMRRVLTALPETAKLFHQ
jgi:hypothetical protein